MSARYERINSNDDDDNNNDVRDIHGNIIQDERHPTASHTRQNSYPHPIPNSPPPSFHSVVGTNNDLEDSFDAPSDDEDHDMRNIRHGPNSSNTFHESVPLVPATAGASASSSSSRLAAGGSSAAAGRTPTPSGRVIGNSNDGVFANISAKPSVPTAEEKAEEHPPTYEQAAADQPPPFWETTILTPGMVGDEVFIDGLPVGTFFAFVWNAIISMSFQLVGFLLTYLLHTTHAAKNGSRAGLGITLIHYGFYIRSSPDDGVPPPEAQPTDPNSFTYDDSVPEGNEGNAADPISQAEWLSYIFMIVGWFILIRSISDFLRARRTEQVVLASPERGLGVPVISTSDTPDRAV